uniref:Uncharacterized protein n=1 Tax=Anguilla anguilla TaxID=7936 RepID=A0A0E9X2T2_ANGAN
MERDQFTGNRRSGFPPHQKAVMEFQNNFFQLAIQNTKFKIFFFVEPQRCAHMGFGLIFLFLFEWSSARTERLDHFPWMESA